MPINEDNKPPIVPIASVYQNVSLIPIRKGTNPNIEEKTIIRIGRILKLKALR